MEIKHCSFRLVKSHITVRLMVLLVALILGNPKLTIGLKESGMRISTGSTLNANQTWTSSNGTFAIGLFSLSPNATYFGIWYAKITSPFRSRIAWVANRENPALDSASLELRMDGNLVLYDNSRKEIWMTHTSGLNVTYAELQESGNFMLFASRMVNTNDKFGIPVWESFDTPGDTLLPGMKIRIGSRLTAWKDSIDPTPGPYSVIVDGTYALKLYWKFRVPYWSSGGFDGKTYPKVPVLSAVNKRYNQIIVEGYSSGSLTIVWNTTELYERIVLSSRGYLELQQYIITDNINKWQRLWLSPEDPCTVYEICGHFGLCSLQVGDPICSCPLGFDSKPLSLGGTFAGCVRTLPINCSTRLRSNDRFYPLANAIYGGLSGDLNIWHVGKTHGWCANKCIGDCSCVAYSYNASGCYIYSNESFSIRNSSISASSDTVYLRLSSQQRLPQIAQSRSPEPAVSAVISLERKRSIRKTLLLVIMIPVVLLAAGSLFIWFWWRHKHTKLLSFPDVFMSNAPHRFSYNDLRIITKNFSQKLGSGGFGDVYKGFLSDNRIIAVKKLKKTKRREKEFYSEVLTIGEIHHVNLVRLVAYCAEGAHRLLVYEYIENGSLDKLLFKDMEKKAILDWEKRFNIALGTARGLAYLHEECRDRIIHCDVKPANILLDRDFSAKISDFGTAKLVGRETSRVITTTRGTRGYMAPEWLSSLPITSKADVYSYGVTLLEIISGRRNIDLDVSSEKWFFPIWASSQLSTGNFLNLTDNFGEENIDKEQLQRAVKVAFWCIQDDPDLRPSMGKIVQILQGDTGVEDPPIPTSFQKQGGGEISSDM